KRRRFETSRPADERLTGSGDLFGGRAEALLELRRDISGPELEVDLEEALQAPCVQVARSGEYLLAVADERLGVKHGRVLDDPHARVEETRVVVPQGRLTPSVVHLPRDEEADSDAARCGLRDPSDHPAVGHVRVDHVEWLGRALEQSHELGRDRPEASRRILEHARPQGRPTRLEYGEQVMQGRESNLSAEPADARQEDELDLRDDRPGDTYEQVVKAAILEVILDAGAPDPPDAAVDDHELAVVNVPKRAEVPPVHPSGAELPAPRTHLHRPHH